MAPNPNHPPALSSLESLPSHLLFDICEYLSQFQPKNRAVLAFSLASKICRDATDRERFRYVHFTILNPRKLRQDVEEYRQMLDFKARLKFVRIMRITGVKMLSLGEEDYIETESNSRSPGLDCLASGLDQPLGFYWLPMPRTPKNKDAHEEAWVPLVELCKILPALQDLIFEVQEQIPRSLLSALHAHHVAIRLHMHHFKLRSLIRSSGKNQDMDPDDIALVTSPCLYSIRALVCQYESPDIVDYNEEVVMEMVKGVTPSLKNVGFVRGRIGIVERALYKTPRPPWRSFPFEDSKRGQPSIGDIRHLALAGGEGSTGGSLLKWSRHTDFRNLSSLEIQGTIELGAVAQLAHMARQSQFTALTTLSLYPCPSDFQGGPEINTMTAELVRSLCPLQNLMIGGVVRESSFHAVIDHHAKTLRKFAFHQLNNKEEIEQFRISSVHAEKLSQRCLELEDLDLRVLRLQGSEEKVLTHQHLSKLPKLKRLVLRLEASMLTVYDDAEEDRSILGADDTSDCQGDATVAIFQDEVTFRDTALDSALVLSILQELGENNRRRTVELRPCIFDVHAPFGSWMRWWGRSWAIKRNPEAGVDVQELEVQPWD